MSLNLSRFHVQWGLRGLKAALSIFIVYHLFAVLLVPNGQSFLGSKSAKWVEPYVNLFEFTNNWSFFAPEPGPPPIYIEYELIDREGHSSEFGRWPSLHNPYALRERQNRKIAAAEFMMSSEVRAEKMMIPYLCKEHNNVGSVRLWRVVYSIPQFRDVAEGKREIGDEIQMERKLVSHSFCNGKFL